MAVRNPPGERIALRGFLLVWICNPDLYPNFIKN
jgi:hypothetical protein